MTPLLLHYPKCSTCRKAAQWLETHGITVQARDIVLQRPAAAELGGWIAASGLPVRRFFNSSGLKYKALGLKDKVGILSENELIDLLASDGMLVKRPLLVLPDRVLVGFREEEWREALHQ